ncbi:hypothetical protein [Geoglobus acetivorans]|uniref:Uncharacterized protein n=1 Tax=Geoglobus acetivorans TaxID=565033 RepID=A0A0A7GD28_GEOAI|nr:hypothetical protein GACE_0891 [Geoglobus acetivorans]
MKMLEGFREEIDGMAKMLEGAAKLREFEEKTGYRVLTGTLPKEIARMIEDGALDEVLRGVNVGEVLKLFDSLMRILDLLNEIQETDVESVDLKELEEIKNSAEAIRKTINEFVTQVS